MVFILPSAGFNGGDGGIAYPSYIHSHWKMDSLTGAVPNEITTASPMVDQGNVPSATGILENGRGPFSNTNYFKASNAIYDQKTPMVEFWIKATTVSEQICEHRTGGNGWGIQVGSGGFVHHVINCTNNLIGDISIVDNNWHYVVAGQTTSDGTAADRRIYVDTVLDTSAVSVNMVQTSETSLWIGENTSQTIPGVHIILDDFCFIDTTKTTWAQIVENMTLRYNAGKGRRYSKDP
jgi:hypothetical protein